MNRYLETLHPWLISLGVVVGLVAVSLFAHWLLFAIARRAAARTRRIADDFLIARARRPARVLIPLLLISLALPELPLPPHVLEPTQRVVAMGFIAVVAWLLIAFLQVIDDVTAARYP